MLIVFGGLPGTGKSTVAGELARRLRALYLRIDTIEQALRSCATLPSGVLTEGYAVAYCVAEDNLRAGCTVVADSVNPLAVTRDAWLSVAQRAATRVTEIEVICSDQREHRRRIEARRSDIPGLKLPSWQDIQARDYEPWTRPRTVLDTAVKSAEQAVAKLLSDLRA